MRSTAAKGLKADKALEVTKVDKVDEAPKASNKVSKPAKALRAKKAKIEDKDKDKELGLNAKLGLKISAGLNMGTLYPLKKRRNVIGRRMDAAFPVQDERASRDHASIDYKKGHFMLNDLGSTNGTYLNNKAVKTPTYIKEGDHIRIGSSVFLVSVINEQNPEMVERWASMTTIVPRTQVMNKAKAEMARPIASSDGNTPRWMHLTKTFAKGQQKHLHQARLFGVALSVLMVAAAILTSLV